MSLRTSLVSRDADSGGIMPAPEGYYIIIAELETIQPELFTGLGTV